MAVLYTTYGSNTYIFSTEQRVHLHPLVIGLSILATYNFIGSAVLVGGFLGGGRIDDGCNGLAWCLLLG